MISKTCNEFVNEVLDTKMFRLVFLPGGTSLQSCCVELNEKDCICCNPNQAEKDTRKDTVTPKDSLDKGSVPTKIYHLNIPHKERNWKLHSGSIRTGLIGAW